MADFERYDAQVVGISVDSVPSHIAFAKSIGGIERYPLLADFHPKGEVSKKYGVFKEDKGICERAIVIVDPLNPYGTVQTADELAALARLADEHGLLLIHDVTHGSLVIDPDVPFASLPARPGDVIRFRAL